VWLLPVGLQHDRAAAGGSDPAAGRKAAGGKQKHKKQRISASCEGAAGNEADAQQAAAKVTKHNGNSKELLIMVLFKLSGRSCGPLWT
jgi:hypothetical protein